MGNRKGAMFHAPTCSWASPLFWGIPLILGHPSQAAPCLTLYGHSLGTDRTAAPSGAKVRAQWEPSDKVFGDVLTTFPNVVHHQAQATLYQLDSRNTTREKGDLRLLHLELVPRAASPKQWHKAHKQTLSHNLGFGKASCRVTCPWPCT